MLFLEKLEQKKFYIILVMIICIIIGIVYTIYFVPQSYITRASLACLKTEETSNGKTQTNGTLELTDNIISTFKEIAQSTLTIKEAQKNNNLDVKSKDISLKKISNSDTFYIKVKNADSSKVVDFSNELINVFSKKAEKMVSNVEIYVIDTPYIESKTFGNSFLISTGISILVGLSITCGYIIFLIQFDKKIKNAKEVESEISLRNLGLIPLNNKKIDIVFNENANLLNSKAFENLRANIQFVNVNNKGKNTILITSPQNAEGKSYIAANLAVSFAEVGKKVILIDADMDNGKQSKIFNIPNNLGFSNYLSNLDANGIEINELINKFINETEFKNLNLITSGTIPPNSSELLSSPKLVDLIKDLSVFYDVVIVDGSKVLSKTDALILTRVVNSTVLVSAYKKTNKDDLWQAKKDIQNVGGRIIGNILNKTRIKEKIKLAKKSKVSEKNNKVTVLEKINNILKNNINKLKNYILDLKNKSKQKLLIEGTEINLQNDSLLAKEEIVDIPKIDNQENTNLEEKTVNYITPIKSLANEPNNSQEKNDVIIKENINVLKNNSQIEDTNSNIPNNAIEENKVSDELYEETEVKVIYKTEHKEELQNDIPNENMENVNIDNKVENIKNKFKTFFNNSKNNILKFADEIKSTTQTKINSIKNSNNQLEENEEKYVVEENEEKVIEEKETKSDKDVAENSKILKSETVVAEPVKINSETILKQDDSKDVIDDLSDNDEAILVIVDAENGYCRAFNKYCFTEKAVRGIDSVDGFEKAHYSSYLLRKRIEGLINLYGITNAQAKRVDTLVYTTLTDYDDTVWLERKMTSNKADTYARCMIKEYEILPNENKYDYEKRCQELRKEELRKELIEIEYNLDGLWKSKKINFTDKLVMNNFAGLYDINTKLKFLKSSSLENEENFKTDSKMKKVKEMISNGKTIIVQKANQIKENISNIKVEQVKAKSVEEIQKEVLESKQNKDNNYDNMSIDEYYSENKDIKDIEEIDYKQVEAERKRELEFFKEQKKEEKMLQKRMAKEEKKARKLEKMKKREETRMNKELEKQKQKQEARIEEELLVDNLYPKTKNNKDI